MYSKQDVSQYSGFSGPEGPSPVKTSSNPDKIQHHYQLKGVGWIGPEAYYLASDRTH